MWRPLTTCLFAGMIYAQNTQPPLSFEVADLRINTSGTADSICNLTDGRLHCLNRQLRSLIAIAWTTFPGDVIGPSWLDDVRLDVVAKASSPRTSYADLRLMLQTLLKNRMKLVAHVEQRQEPAFALDVWKGQPKLEKSTPPAKPEDADCSVTTTTSGNAQMICRHITMTSFARWLSHEVSGYVDKRVVDETGLEGVWDVTLDFTPNADLESNGGLTLFAAMQAQLGLHLESKRLAVPVLVVDSMEKSPGEN